MAKQKVWSGRDPPPGKGPRLPQYDLRFLAKRKGDGYDGVHQEHHKDFPEEIVGTKTSPPADHLFTVRDPSLVKVLSEEQVMAFHHTKAQLLFLSARARRDIQPATAFLTMQVMLPDEDDWGKVKRVLSYLKGYSAHAPHPVGGLANALTVVGGCSVRCTRQLPRAYRGGDELWPGNGPELLLET